MSLQVHPVQRAALEAACEALVPSLPAPEGGDIAYWASTAKDLDVAGQILEIIATQTPSEQQAFHQLLRLLESKVAGWWWGGYWERFRDMPLERRARVLRKWRDSRVNLLRKAYATLKKLTLFLHYGSHRDGVNPTWKLHGYPGAFGAEPGTKARIVPLEVQQDTELSCDVVVVGSGAGGGLAAGLLAEAGWDVMVLEKGPCLSGEDFTEREVEMIRRTYDRQGAFQTRNGGVTIFAGACLGGGTTINWTGAFPTPEYVLDEWAHDHGLGFATSGEYQRSMDHVMRDLRVNADNSFHNPQNQALWRGSEQLGEHVEVIARNVEGCTAHPGTHSCGYCGMGCRRGNKRGTLATYLQRAADKGARIIVGAEVQVLRQARGQVQAVEAYAWTGEGKRICLRVRTPCVVMAAGSIHSPAILMRSGIGHPALGRNLFFHPTVGVTGIYPEPMRPWLGPMMSAVNKHSTCLDGNYGFWVETPPVHPGVGAMALAWENPGQHKAALLRAAHMGTFIVLTRDRQGGRVTLDRTGHPAVDYALSRYDRDHMFSGMKKAFELHRAAGATEVLFPHATPRSYKFLSSKIAPEEWLGRMAKWGWRPNQYALFTAHQMGTCAMGGDPRHPVDPSGKVRGVKGLYVADGSLLPSSAGINPMITIMALAHKVTSEILGNGIKKPDIL